MKIPLEQDYLIATVVAVVVGGVAVVDAVGVAAAVDVEVVDTADVAADDDYYVVVDDVPVVKVPFAAAAAAAVVVVAHHYMTQHILLPLVRKYFVMHRLPLQV